MITNDVPTLAAVAATARVTLEGFLMVEISAAVRSGGWLDAVRRSMSSSLVAKDRCALDSHSDDDAAEFWFTRAILATTDSVTSSNGARDRREKGCRLRATVFSFSIQLLVFVVPSSLTK